MKHNLIPAILILVFFGLHTNVLAGNSEREDHLLFKIKRSRDADEIWYCVNIDHNGVPDPKHPITAFWVRKEDDNQKEPLTWIQRKYAYGLKFLDSMDAKNENLSFQFVSYSEQFFELRKTRKGEYRVFTKVEQKEIELTQIFVQFDGGSFWVPSIPFVRIKGKDPGTLADFARKYTF